MVCKWPIQVVGHATHTHTRTHTRTRTHTTHTHTYHTQHPLTRAWRLVSVVSRASCLVDEHVGPPSEPRAWCLVSVVSVVPRACGR